MKKLFAIAAMLLVTTALHANSAASGLASEGGQNLVQAYIHVNEPAEFSGGVTGFSRTLTITYTGATGTVTEPFFQGSRPYRSVNVVPNSAVTLSLNYIGMSLHITTEGMKGHGHAQELDIYQANPVMYDIRFYPKESMSMVVNMEDMGN